VIYFIQAGDDGPIKIGSSENIPRRIAGLQVGNPAELHVLGVFPEEYELHTHFADIHIRGEWLKPEPQLLDFIKQYTCETPDPGWNDISRAFFRRRNGK
jgi:hypothetical protein